jgi:hypothetical protein
MLLIAFVTLVFAGYGQKLKQDEVPAAVKNSFNKKFPGIKGVEWSKESASEFEAEFEVSGNEQSANFDQSGKWLETETEIKKSALPANVQATIKKEFPDFSIEEAEKAETADGMIYEVEIEKGEVNYEVEISTDGKVIKKEEKKEKDDKD